MRSRSIIRVVVVTSCLVCLPTRVVPAAAPSPQAVRRDAPAVPDYLFSFALAADGKTFAAGSVTEYSNDGAVYVGDLETPSLHWSVQSHRVLALAFSPDGALLATGHLGVSRNYGEVRLWNSHKGRVLFNLLGHRGIVHSVSFSPDGRFLASSGREITRSGRWRGQLFVWDTQSGQARIRVDEKRGPVGPVVFSRDGAMLISAVASSPYRSTIVIRDAQTGRVVRNLKQRFGAILAMEVYPDGRHLAVGSAEDAVTVNPQRSAGEVLYWLGGYARTAWRRGRITVLDLGSGESVWTYRDFRGQVSAIDLSADGRRLAATGVGVEVRPSARGNLAKPRQRKWVILSAEDGREIVSRSGGFAVDAMAFAPDGDQLITTGVDNRILTWSADGALTRALAREAWLERQHNPAVVNVRRIVNLAFSVDGGYLLSGDDQGSTRIWDVAGTTEIASIDGQGRFRSLAVFSSDGSHAAFFDPGGRARLGVLDLNLRTIRWLDTGSTMISHLAAGPGILVGGSQDGELIVWDSRDWTLRTRCRLDSGIQCLASDLASGLLGVGCADGALLLLDEFLQSSRTTHLPQLSAVHCISFAPGLQLLAAAGPGGEVLLLDLRSLEIRNALSDFDAPVQSIAFSPDGRRLAATGLDGSLVCWDTSSWKRTWRNRRPFAATVAVFSPDGNTMAAGWADNLVALYNPQTGRLLTVLGR